jgi:hypothetical protein
MILPNGLPDLGEINNALFSGYAQTLLTGQGQEGDTAMRKQTKIIAAFLLLTSCAGMNDEAAKDAIAQEKAQAAAIAQQDDARCQSFGATRGSEAYARCRASLKDHRAEVNTYIRGPKE